LGTADDLPLRSFGNAMQTGLRLLEEQLIPLHQAVGSLAEGKAPDQALEIPSVSGTPQLPGIPPSVLSESELARGLTEPILAIKTAGEAAEFAKNVAGIEAFVLYDTHGFPPELTAEIAREHGLEVDLEGFQQEMAAKQEQDRASHAFAGGMELVTTYENLGAGRTNFVGYSQLEQESVVAALLVDNASSGHATQGQRVEVVLEATPFYAESGDRWGTGELLPDPTAW
ncbi:MAG: alanine--tRNA ligase-related protein, partial [Dehalococcoidia bacterium]